MQEKASDLDTAARQSAQGTSSKGSDLDGRSRNERENEGRLPPPAQRGAPSAPPFVHSFFFVPRSAVEVGALAGRPLGTLPRRSVEVGGLSCIVPHFTLFLRISIKSRFCTSSCMKTWFPKLSLSFSESTQKMLHNSGVESLWRALGVCFLRVSHIGNHTKASWWIFLMISWSSTPMFF